jgi:membrane-associated protease RseP (regulator of RpoE activity)
MAVKIMLIIFIIITLLGCVTIMPLNTTTGKPEIFITDTPKKEITNAIINTMLTWDFQLQKSDEYILVFGKKNTDIATSLLLGSRYDPTPEWRYTFNLVESGYGIRIIGNIVSVTNPGSAFEKQMDFSKQSKAATNLQKYFESLKEEFNIKNTLKYRGKIGVKLQGNVIYEVFDKSPAEKAGLLQGDILLEIDGIPLSANREDFLRISGEPGSVVILLLQRDNQEISIPVTRGNP